MATSAGVCPCTSLMGLKSMIPFSASILPMLFRSRACIPFARRTPTASRTVTSRKPSDRIKTSLPTPERNAIVVHSVATRAEWLEGMLPVRQSIRSKSSPTLCTLREKSFISVLMICEENQLKMQESSTGFVKNKCSCSLAFAIPLFYAITKFCLVEKRLFLYYYRSMEFRSFSAGPDDDGRRIGRILKTIFKDTPGARYQEALRKKLIKVNGARVPQDYRVKAGDSISVAAFLLDRPDASDAPGSSTPAAAGKAKTDITNIQFKTIFRNEHIWLLDKPYGIPVQPSQGCATSIAGIVAQMQAAAARSSIAFTPAPLHRLDRYTTGLLALSQSMEGAQWFSRALQEHRIRKTYLGITQGIPARQQRWQDKLAAVPGSTRGAFHTVQAAPGGAPAVTEALTLASGTWHAMPVALVQFRIETGRKHQIRAQSALHGCPLIGDSAYGACSLPGGRAFFLHAAHLAVPGENPLGLPESISAPIPAEFAHFLTSALIKWDEQIIL